MKKSELRQLIREELLNEVTTLNNKQKKAIEKLAQEIVTKYEDKFFEIIATNGTEEDADNPDLLGESVDIICKIIENKWTY